MVGFATKDCICVFGYDATKRGGQTTLVVGKRVNGKMTKVAQYYGTEAEAMYKKLKLKGDTDHGTRHQRSV